MMTMTVIVCPRSQLNASGTVTQDFDASMARLSSVCVMNCG